MAIAILYWSYILLRKNCQSHKVFKEIASKDSGINLYDSYNLLLQLLKEIIIFDLDSAARKLQ